MAVAAAPSSVYRSFTLRANTAEMRVAQFQSRDHIVVPVVALVEGVIYPNGAAAPELVPEALFARLPQAWNGRPIVIDHPVVDGAMTLACTDPAVLERELSGTVFGACVKNHRLSMEAWIDVSRVAVVGQKLSDMIERVKAGDPIEVSVGAMVMAAESRGVYKGKPYYGTWVDYGPDHLALLSKGDVGACSRDMGCGVRVAHIVTDAGMVTIPRGEQDMATRTKRLTDRIRDLLRLGVTEEDMTDVELRRAVDAALRASVPGYLGIIEIAPGAGSVVFETCPGDTYLTMMSSFTVDDKGAATLKGEPQVVEPVTEYRPVAAEGVEETPRAACGCGGAGNSEDTTTTKAANQPQEDTMTKTERVAALIANAKTPWKQENAAMLEGASEELLASLEAQAAATVETPAATTTTETPAPAATTVTAQAATAETPAEPTLEALLAKASPDMRAAFAEIEAKAKAEKAGLIERLAKSGRSSFTPEQLQGKAVEELRALCALLPADPKPKAAVSFAGLGLPKGGDQSQDDQAVPPAPDLTESIRAARGQAVTK